jgi:hypothetical protein
VWLKDVTSSLADGQAGSLDVLTNPHTLWPVVAVTCPPAPCLVACRHPQTVMSCCLQTSPDRHVLLPADIPRPSCLACIFPPTRPSLQLAPLLSLPRLLRAELYALRGQAAAYRGLQAQIDGLLQRHSAAGVVLEAAGSLVHAARTGPAALQVLIIRIPAVPASGCLLLHHLHVLFLLPQTSPTSTCWPASPHSFFPTHRRQAGRCCSPAPQPVLPSCQRQPLLLRG